MLFTPSTFLAQRCWLVPACHLPFVVGPILPHLALFVSCGDQSNWENAAHFGARSDICMLDLLPKVSGWGRWLGCVPQERLQSTSLTGSLCFSHLEKKLQFWTLFKSKKQTPEKQTLKPHLGFRLTPLPCSKQEFYSPSAETNNDKHRPRDL